MIDEFQTLGRMSYLERAIDTVAADGVSVAMIAQSVAALDRLYGREGRKAFESGAGLRLFIAPRDLRTAREVSVLFAELERLSGGSAHADRLERGRASRIEVASAVCLNSARS